MRYVESYLERNDIPYNYRGRSIYVPTKDRYQPKEICDHLKLPDIQYFEDGKRSTLFVANKKFIARDASSFFSKAKIGVTLEDVGKLQKEKLKAKKKADKLAKELAKADKLVYVNDDEGLSLAKFERLKREKLKQEKEERSIAKIKEDNYLPFVWKFVDKKPKLWLFWRIEKAIQGSFLK